MNDMMFMIPELIWPCWAYVLRRLRYGHLLSKEWMHDVMPGLLKSAQDECVTPYSSGTILVWKNRQPLRDHFPVSIPVPLGGAVIHQFIKYEYHAGIYEGKYPNTYGDAGVVSDMVSPDGRLELPYIIRLRPLNQVLPPDFVLLPSDLVEYDQRRKIDESAE